MALNGNDSRNGSGHRRERCPICHALVDVRRGRLVLHARAVSLGALTRQALCPGTAEPAQAVGGGR